MDVDADSPNARPNLTPLSPVILQQKQEEAQEFTATVANEAFIKHQIERYTERLQNARDVRKVKLGSGIKTDAQVLAMSELADVYEEELKYYQSLLDSITPDPEQATENPAPKTTGGAS